MRDQRSFVVAVALSLMAVSIPEKSEAQWRLGGATEFFAPMGDLNPMSLLGLSLDVYGGHSLVRRKLAVTADAGIHWFIPNEVTVDELPDWVDPDNLEPDSQGIVTVSGTFVPVRGSMTLLFDRFYVSPKVGAYIPFGGFRKDLDLGTKLGVAPRAGYLFLMAPDVQFDFAVEYNYLFGEETLHYVGFSMGLFFGGRRMGRYY